MKKWWNHLITFNFYVFQMQLIWNSDWWKTESKTPYWKSKINLIPCSHDLSWFIRSLWSIGLQNNSFICDDSASSLSHYVSCHCYKIQHKWVRLMNLPDLEMWFPSFMTLVRWLAYATWKRELVYIVYTNK